MTFYVKTIFVMLLAFEAMALRLNHDLDYKARHQRSLSKLDLLHAKNPQQVHFAEAVEALSYVINSADAKTILELNFKENIKGIVADNSNTSLTFKEGINQFVFLSPEQFTAQMLTLRVSDGPHTVQAANNQKPLASHLRVRHEQQTTNWKNRMTGVRNQGDCGSCWAFAIVGDVEGRYKLKFNKDIDLSEQQLLDCNTDGNDCNGGFYDTYDYVLDKGLVSESSYPYKAKRESCKYNSKNVAVKIKDTHDIGWFSSWFVDCEDLQDALKTGPIAVAVHSETSKWQKYKNGTLNTCTLGNKVDHAVLVVGWNKASNLWTIKNSWGKGWGEQGYITLKGGNCNRVCEHGYYASL